MAPSGTSAPPRRRLRAELRAGFAYLVRARLILTLTIMQTMINLCLQLGAGLGDGGLQAGNPRPVFIGAGVLILTTTLIAWTAALRGLHRDGAHAHALTTRPCD
jgi:hypothetical protein